MVSRMTQMKYLLYLIITFTVSIPSFAHGYSEAAAKQHSKGTKSAPKRETYTVKRVHEGINTSRAIEEPLIQISFLGQYDTQKYDRKVHTRYNTRENRHTKKYDKNKHKTYNGKQSKKRIKYVKNKHNTYNEKENKHTGKHTKKHTKKYYSQYHKMH